jgi:hypothetical protein
VARAELASPRGPTAALVGQGKASAVAGPVEGGVSWAEQAAALLGCARGRQAGLREETRPRPRWQVGLAG